MKTQQEIHEEIENQISMHGKDNVRVIAQNIAEFVQGKSEMPTAYKTPIECLSEATYESVEELQRADEVQIVRPSEAIEAIEAYHAQFNDSTSEPLPDAYLPAKEKVCEWNMNGDLWGRPQCNTLLESRGITSDYKYCPFCGGKIKRV